jgi:XRE family transcriptional regulator, regulator of sulfur utilization
MPRAKANETKQKASLKPVAGGRSTTQGSELNSRLAPVKPSVRSRRAAIRGDELGAAELTRRVAESLRRFRQDRQLSLDDLADRSGVSRAALSQIEGKRTNPTLSVLWKVAVGLEVPFHSLLGGESNADIFVLRASDSTVLRSTDGRMESRLLSPGRSSTSTEIYELRFLPRALHKSEPHTRGTTETLVVLTGTVRLNVNGATQDVSAGDAVFFRADVTHSYENPTARDARCMNVIHYPR